MTPNQIKKRKQLEKMISLYEDKKWNLREIGDKFGLTHQAVHARIVKAGVKMRGKGKKKKRLDYKLLKNLYLTKELTMTETAKKLKTSINIVSRELDRYKITKRSVGDYIAKYTFLKDLKLGDQISIKRPEALNPYSTLHFPANRLGIKIEVRKIDNKTMQVTRIK